MGVFARKGWLYFIAIVIIFLSYYTISDGYFFMLAIPFAIIEIYLLIYRIDLLILGLFFLTPLSIEYRFGDYGLNVPTELVLIPLFLLFILKILRGELDTKIFRHPVSICILLHLLWIFITTLNSQMFWVSFKFFLSRCWFVLVMYFWVLELYKKEENITRTLWLYLAGFSIVIGYIFVIHSRHGFVEEVAHWAPTPFYNDHTAYGAALALYLPPLVALLVNMKGWKRFIPLGYVLLLLVCLVFSYTRASWLGIAVACIITFLHVMRIKPMVILLSVLIMGCVGVMMQDKIRVILEHNKQDSSSNFLSHIQSMANVSTDASNIERFNRWAAAFRMFAERPVMGFGPGTYMFLYAPYQRSFQRSTITTNLGNLGNAHSEYFGPLSEQGIFGLLMLLSILVAVSIKAIQLIRDKSLEKKYRNLVFGVLMGLITYFIHGCLNNFLDTDKASIPVWSFMAIIVAIDLYCRKDSGKLESAAAGQ